MSEITAQSSTEISAPLLATINARIFVEKAKAPQKAKDNYYSWKGIKYQNKRNLLLPTFRDDRIDYVESAFDELFSLESDDEEGLATFRNEHGEEANVFLSIRDRVNSDLDSFKQKTETEASKWGLRQRMGASLHVLKELPNLSSEQRAEILAESGYSNDDIRKIIIRGAMSGAAYTALYLAEDYVSDLVGYIGGPAISLSGGQISHTLAFASAMAYYATKALKIEQTLSMAKDERISVIPNPSAVVGYHLFEKMFSDKPNFVDWATRASYMLNPLELWQERWWIFFPFTPEVFFAGNVAAIVVNLAEAGLIEASKWSQIKAFNRFSSKPSVEGGIK